jgi:hypothetical protein
MSPDKLNTEISPREEITVLQISRFDLRNPRLSATTVSDYILRILLAFGLALGLFTPPHLHTKKKQPTRTDLLDMFTEHCSDMSGHVQTCLKVIWASYPCDQGSLFV